MPALGAPELILILVIVLVIFGAGKLPQIGNALGKSIREFRSASEIKDDPPTTADTIPTEQKKSGL